MAISKPCPRCQQPLEIPEPIPEKVTCSKCGAVIKYKVQAAPAPAKEEPAKPAPAVAVGKPALPAPAPAPAVAAAAIATGPPEVKPAEKLSDAAPVASSGGLLAILHTIIPKPILFGTYGALGGVLGVLLLGELFWLFLHPTPQELQPLIVALPQLLTVYPDSQGVLPVTIKRNGFEGPVTIEALEQPREFIIDDAMIGETDDTAKVKIATVAQARKSAHEVKLRITSTVNPKISVIKMIPIYIEPTPPIVRITSSPKVTVYAGSQNSFGFKVARGRFEGPVRVEVLDLPKGIQMPLVTLQEKEVQGVMPVAAQRDAEVGAKTYYLEVRSLRDHKVISQETVFQLDVKPPPGKLQLAASPRVTVFPGTKNKIFVKISRAEFSAPIEIIVSGGPRGVTFSPKTIPADKTETEIDVFATQEAKPGKDDAKLEVTARAVDTKENIHMEVPVELKIEAPPPAVLLAVSPKVSVYPAGTAKFFVKINRARFDGPVTVTAQAANPNLLKIATITIPADQTEAEMVLSADNNALSLLPANPVMRVTVTATKVGGASKSATAELDVEFLPPPSDLQITVSPEVEVYQNGKCTFTVKVARTGFLGPVQIQFDNPPPGITFTPGVLAGNELIFKGQASTEAALKKHVIEVTATGPKAPDGKIPTTKKKFDLTVKPFQPPLDIVFVLDITQSLDPEIAGLRAGIGQFVKGLKDKELEARIGLIGFRDITVPDEVHFEYLKFDKGELFTTDIKAFANELGKLKASGGGDDPESSLDAVFQAAKKYPFRPKAVKILLLITDEKPQTKGNSVTMKIAQQALRDGKIDQVHLIIKKADLPNYKGLQDVAKGGVFEFPKTSDKVKRDDVFATLLPLLSKEIATTIGAPEPPVAKVPPLPDSAAAPPSPPGEKAPEPKAEASKDATAPAAPPPLKAGEAPAPPSDDAKAPEADKVAAPPVAAGTIQGVQSTAIYAEADRLQLLIAIALWTAALAGGIALTLVAAQKLYLRQAWLSLGEVAKALAAGLTAGLLAGIIGQWFYQSTSGFTWSNAISRVVAWAILGGMIGGGMGAFVPNMRLRRAILGGCLGGLIGALGFLLVSGLAKAYLEQYIGEGFVSFLGRLIGAALLGMFIGFMVAMAELASRRYWLEVAFGEREIRTVTLGTDTVAIGGDERQVGVYVPNAPPKALGFRVDKDRVLCEEFTTGKTSVAPPGDQRTLANARIKVCSVASAEPTGANLRLIVRRDVPLMIGMPLTADDIPGLEAQGSDGVVALVSRRPNNPKIFLLRNRSKQAWTVTEADGKPRKVDPGLSIELSSRCEIDFGQVKATLDPAHEG